MIINTVTAINPYPNERFFISINPIEPALENARLGTRFIYDYYNTGEEKLIITPTPSLSSATDTFTQPTCFVSYPDAFPVTWTPGHDKQYAFLSFLGATSAITVYPTQPWPKITKLSNNHIQVSANILPYQYFDYEIHREEFKKQVSLSALTNGSIISLSTTPWPVYTSQSYRNYPLYLTKNNKPTLATFVPKGIIDNSFKIEIPLVSAAGQEDVWYYSMHDSTSNTISVVKNTGTLAGMYMEDISSAGISFPYTTNNTINYNTGKITMNTRSPLLFPTDEFITVTCETSSRVTNNTIASAAQITPNNYRLRSNLPIYFYNFPFRASGTGYAAQDAFTISFFASSFITSQTTSSVEVSSLMIDNFYQTKYDIDVNSSRAVKRFVERTEDYSLSAYDIRTGRLYKNMQWMPASAHMRFINDGLGNNYTAGIQVSTFTGAIYEDYNDVNFILNGDNIIFNLSITEQTDLSARVSALIFPSADETLPVKWDVFPPENIVLRNPNTGEIIQRNVFYPGDTFDVDIFNLGVDRTKITLYSQEYNTSAHTFWFPSTAIYNDLSLVITDNISDYNEIKSGNLNAMISRNGALYRAPETANISWKETLNDPRGNIQFINGDFTENIVEATIYPSINNYSMINVSAVTNKVENNPKNISFNINCNLFNEFFELETNKLINMREYPVGELLTMDFKNSFDNIVRNTENNKSLVYKNAGTITLSAVYPEINFADTNLRWELSGTTFYQTGSGQSISFYLSSPAVNITLSGLNGKPFDGGFKYYNFTDNLQLFYLSSANVFDYIGFPENSYFPQTTNSFSNFTNSQGTTAYDKVCHTENFYFSASPGFSTYNWRIGDIDINTPFNTIIIPLNYNNVSATNTIYVSAFNQYFLENGFGTQFNSISSDSSNKFKQPINFINYPDVSATITLTNDVVNTQTYKELPTLFGLLSPQDLIQSYNLSIVLSSVDGYQYYNVQNTNPDFSKLLKIGIQDTDFLIKENSFNNFNVFLSGNVNKIIKNFDFCNETQTITSNIIPITAYNGPNLSLYTDTPILSTNQIGIFYNTSNNLFGSNTKSFSAFIFDPGNGNTQTTTLSTLTASYSTEGYYTPSLTGILYDGSFVSKEWNDLIYVADTFQAYNPLIKRELQLPLEPLYEEKEILISPNSWQYAKVFNNSVYKIDNFINYLSANCYAYNISFPKTQELYLTDRFGSFKWSDETINIFPKETFKNIKSIQLIDNILLCINENRIELYDISVTPSLVFSTNKLGDSELLKNPIKLQYYDSKLFVLDNTKKTFFVCDFDLNNPTAIKLVNYWGGPGDKNDKTKLNNPTDFTIDSNGNIYIVDNFSLLIKVYNKNLSWIENIELPFFNDNVKPLSISINGTITSITCSDNNTYVINNESVTTIYVENSIKSILNSDFEGLVYILANNTIFKYTIDGTFISMKSYNYDVKDLITIDKKLIIISGSDLIQTTDFIDNISIFDQLYTGFDLSTILVDEKEFVTDYIFNDSFKKLSDNINILNNNIDKKFVIELNEYNDIVNITTSAISVSSLTFDNLIIATNEPVTYDTINRGFKNLYKALIQLMNKMETTNTVPENANEYKWNWKYHYIDSTQYPSLFKNPVSWKELTSNKLTNSILSSVSSWCSIRDDSGGGNHSEVCFNYQYLQCNSLMPMTWESLECDAECSRVFTWEDLERDCCIFPDYIFADKISAC